MEQLSGKVAIVTGAGGGIGAAVARLFVAAGARIALTDIQTAEGPALASELGAAAIFVPHDVSSGDAWSNVIARTEEAFGPVSILVNNAGISQAPVLTDACSEVEYRRIIDVNQISVFLGMRAVAPSMRRAGGGAIVNLSSVAGLVGQKGAIAYVASKFAVTGMTKTAALDFSADKIRVNSVHPGAIDTPMLRAVTAGTGPNPVMDFCATLPIPRLGDPMEIAQVVLFLASDAASFCTGASFSADGGWTI